MNFHRFLGSRKHIHNCPYTGTYRHTRLSFLLNFDLRIVIISQDIFTCMIQNPSFILDNSLYHTDMKTTSTKQSADSGITGKLRTVFRKLYANSWGKAYKKLYPRSTLIQPQFRHLLSGYTKPTKVSFSKALFSYTPGKTALSPMILMSSR